MLPIVISKVKGVLLETIIISGTLGILWSWHINGF
jgi:hypothetical protein